MCQQYYDPAILPTCWRGASSHSLMLLLQSDLYMIRPAGFVTSCSWAWQAMVPAFARKLTARENEAAHHQQDEVDKAPHNKGGHIIAEGTGDCSEQAD